MNEIDSSGFFSWNHFLDFNFDKAVSSIGTKTPFIMQKKSLVFDQDITKNFFVEMPIENGNFLNILASDKMYF